MGITLLGTSHIAQQSILQIRKSIEKTMPDIVALELDTRRAHSLFKKEKSKISYKVIPIVGLKGYLFAKVGQIVQQKLGGVVGVDPGSDMREGLIQAKKHKLDVALIDQPIEITLKNFSKTLSWKERFRFVGDIFGSIVSKQKQLEKFGMDNFDLRTVPGKEVIKKMIGYLKKRYPSIHKSLIEDRNKYMVKKLILLQKKNPGKEILAIVGAGHEDGMQELLHRVDIL
jgi:pheromone shutdown protein TraB